MGRMHSVRHYCPDCEAWRDVRIAQKTASDPVKRCRQHARRRKADPSWRLLDANGYVRVRRGGRVVYEHRAVWQDAHGAIPPGYHVHHRNADRADNRLENLELIEGRRHVGSHSMTLHARRQIDNRGPRSGRWRELDDAYIVRRREEGASFRQIALEVSASWSTVVHHYRLATA